MHLVESSWSREGIMTITGESCFSSITDFSDRESLSESSRPGAQARIWLMSVKSASVKWGFSASSENDFLLEIFLNGEKPSGEADTRSYDVLFIPKVMSDLHELMVCSLSWGWDLRLWLLLLVLVCLAPGASPQLVAVWRTWRLPRGLCWPLTSFCKSCCFLFEY